jgi:hypothetical protein
VSSLCCYTSSEFLSKLSVLNILSESANTAMVFLMRGKTQVQIVTLSTKEDSEPEHDKSNRLI